MRKIILVLLVVFAIGLCADEWVKINDRDYKLFKIYPELNIVVSDGYYDIVIEDGEIVSMTHLGGLGNYFYYAGEKQNIRITQAMIDSLTVQCYGEPIEEE